MAKKKIFSQVWEENVGRRLQHLASSATDPPDIYEAVIYMNRHEPS